VSSTGHLILFVDLLGFQGPPGRVFEIIIQFGAILAVCWHYRAKLRQVFSGLLVRDVAAQHFTRNIALAFLPAMVMGILFHDVIKTVLFSPLVVSVALIVGGVLILMIERYKPLPTLHSTEAMPWRTALAIGCFQVLAMVPGVSRSGATIMGALLCKMDRKAATEFSFFLAIPTMLGAASFDVYKNYTLLNLHDATILATGFFAAFITALLVVKTVVGFVSKHGFVPFAYYRIAVGSVMLALMAF
jgi:undecaprenyl-diphosphatase